MKSIILSEYKVNNDLIDSVRTEVLDYIKAV
jgi:hypothetical protein